MDLDELPSQVDGPSHLVVRRVRSVQELADVSRVFAANWDPPDQSAVVFYENAAPVLLKEDCAMKLFIDILMARQWQGAKYLSARKIGVKQLLACIL